MAGDVEGSREDLEESLSLSPRNPLAALFHCYVLIELRLLDKAIDQLTQLWRTFTLETIYIAAGDAYRLRGDVVEAAKWWDATLALAQSCPNPVHNHSDAVAYCLVRQGHTDEAPRAVEAALVQDPKNQLAAYTKALISNQRDDLDSLEQILEGLSPFRVMTALMDPDFTPLLTEPRFREILANALEERQRTVAEIRRRINGSAA